MSKFYTKISLSALLLIQFLFVQQINAQNCWAPLGSGIGTPTDPGGIFVSTIYNGNLIVAGQFDTAGGVPAANIAQWNGTSWSALGVGIKLRGRQFNTTGGIVHGLAVYNGELYASGAFDTAGGAPAANIAKWNGTTWAPVGSGIQPYTVIGPFDTVSNQAGSMAVYNNELYVSGDFTTAGGIMSNNIARWNGNSWSAVGAGIAGGQDPTSTGVDYLTVINGKLYAGGDFETASGLSAINIAAWDGSAWTALGTGVGNDTAGRGGVSCIASYDGDIYASYLGYDPGYNPTFSIEKWNGTSWSSVVGGPGTGIYYYGYVFSMLPFNGSLLAAGYFPVIGNDSSANGLAQFNGATWSSLGTGTDTSEYYSPINFNSHLYVGGYFATISGISASSIVEYTCATSSSINEIKTSANVHLFPNPTNGIFNITIENLQDKAIIQIYNLLGQQVLQSNIISDKIEINLSGQASGTYLYHISGANAENIGSGTFVVQ